MRNFNCNACLIFKIQIEARLKLSSALEENEKKKKKKAGEACKTEGAKVLRQRWYFRKRERGLARCPAWLAQFTELLSLSPLLPVSVRFIHRDATIIARRATQGEINAIHGPSSPSLNPQSPTRRPPPPPPLHPSFPHPFSDFFFLYLFRCWMF